MGGRSKEGRRNEGQARSRQRSGRVRPRRATVVVVVGQGSVSRCRVCAYVCVFERGFWRGVSPAVER